MQEVFDVIEQVAATRASVLITGESGTGKELVAQAIHENSPRASAPFVKLHCAALAETLLESELFGHEKGSFTGAAGRREGRVEQAHGGTLFLDEIGAMSPATQIKLLRFLQEHAFERLGGNETLQVDVRIIAATNRDLPSEIAVGKFRQDLYYRLNVVGIEMPPLRVVLCDGRELSAEHLPPGLSALPRAGVRVPGSTMKELERYAILATLEACGGRTTQAAHMLDISVRKIQYKLHEYGVTMHRTLESSGSPPH
jgi:two-component system response regulator HydG